MPRIQTPHLLAATLIGAALATSPAAHAALSFGTNAVQNGDAEAGTGGAGEDVAIPGWSTSDPVNGMTVVQYVTGDGFPLPTDPGPADRGANFFAGGPSDPVTSITQSLSVTNAAAAINAGVVSFSLTGYIGGYASQNDNDVFSVEFLNGVGTEIGSQSIGPVSAADRGDATGLLSRAATGFIPVGTQSLLFTLTATRTDGTFNDGYADDLSFIATSAAPPPPPPSVPEPATMTLLAAGLAGFAMVRRKRS